MKLKNKIKTLLGVSLVLSASACESYLDVNDNPNNPQDAPISGLMTNITYETSWNVYREGSAVSNYVQYLASPNPGSSSDTMEPLNFSSLWFSLYNVMTDLYTMNEKAEAEGARHYLGAGQVLMALNLGMTVDLFGDVPFSESFNFTTVTPAYDDDKALYGNIMSLLDQGISNLQATTTSSMGNDDFIYGGDLDLWLKFAHTLKARYMIHQKGDPGYSAAEVLAAVDKGFKTNDQNAQVVFFEQRFNPWASDAIANANLNLTGWISEQFIQALDGTSYPTVDPRLKLMVGTTKEGKFVGTVNGAGRGNAPEQGARSTLVEGQYYTSRQAPLLIATFAELKFIEAEAAFATDKTRAYAAYLAGIEAHMNMLSVNSTEKSAYLTHPSVSMGAAALTIDAIFKEKYVAMFLHPETWNDARRYDYGYKNMTLPENLNPDLGGKYLRRLAYPDSEVSRNGANVPVVSLLDRVWWNQ
ncbi:SusD-like starch-binding protein associating with outer membrane [Algoriphagus ratkowskyi]|uniref:SusD-like starch-binding protein associating with outer membrane n=1 Tax=Algoriphagus ratkowskyi TaxID=57028 RepID=A0A2W7R9W8_9BACT|nr:SusD/RagB family nutrient-binding outer membrane lipoprotein [Algoriphagus ratkowskyi]PZX57723.1 SusD-like starch-binding protein associating with outer membrane [Algoriphagus ratkowskyi]TXD78992.1 SusD/RagB family nutrient-binding outer membrane lipoprotein [Algoriphagus ratkowskyi]